MLFAPVLSAVLAACLLSADQAQPFPWNRDFAEAQKVAQAAQKPMMLYFTTDWCGWCKVMERETFVDPKVQAQATRYVPVMLDAEKEGKALAAKYKVDSYPTFVFVQPSGEVVGVLGGFRNAADFQERVVQILDAKSEEARLKAALNKNPDDPVANAEMAIRSAGDGNVKVAELHLEKVRKAGFKGPEMAKALSDVGQSYFTIDLQKAMVYFEESLACKDKATTSVTFNRLMLASLYAGDRAVSLNIAKRMAESEEASPEARAQGASFLKAEDYGKQLQSPEQVVDAFVKQLQHMPNGKRDAFYFTNLFLEDAAVKVVINRNDSRGAMSIETTFKTLIDTLAVDRLESAIKEVKRDVRQDADLATVRLEMEWTFTPEDGPVRVSTSIVNLQLIVQGHRWYIASLAMQTKPKGQTD